MPHTADYHKPEEDYIDPNHLMGKDGTTFIYTLNGDLHHANGSIAHKNMLDDDNIWHNVAQAAKINKETPKHGFKRRAVAENNSILGRIGVVDGRKIISFWGSDKHILKKYIKDCLQKLLTNNLINKNTIVFTLIFKTTNVKDVLNNNLIDKNQNKKEYKINGKTYTWDYLRDIRIKTHTDPEKENVLFLCNLLTPEVINQYPELRALIPTNCESNKVFKPSKLQNYLSGPKAPNWGPMYPTIGDWTLNFKEFLNS